MEYTNPVIRGFYPDPSVCRVESDYYLVTSSFEYLPAIPIFKSKDLVNWKSLGYCLVDENQIDLKGTKNSGGIFAPTIRFYKDRFYVITTDINKGSFYVTSDQPENGWSMPIFIDIDGIDPSLYFESDRAFVQYASFGRVNSIKQVEIDISSGELLSEPEIISYGSGGRDVEAPHVYKFNDYYYLITAEGGTREGHMVTIRRGKALYGPFEECPNNPILSNRDKSRELIQNVGHFDLIQDQFGDWWGLGLGVRSIEHTSNIGREALLLPVKWSNGWPSIYKGFAEERITIKRKLTNDVVQQNIHYYKDDFQSNNLPFYWNSIREFWTSEVFVEGGKLNLNLLPGNLNSLEKISFVGRRQQSLKFKVTCILEFFPEISEEAGLTIYIDKNHHFELCVAKSEAGRSLNVKKKLSDIETNKQRDILGEKLINLRIIGTENSYIFYYSINNEDYIYVGKTRAKYLSTEISDSPFTGVFIGMYGTSNGLESNNTAKFHSFVYEDV